MDRIIWERIIEDKIQEAMAAGEFDNLPGVGKPLDLEENPFEDPDWRMAHHIMRTHNITWPWMEERKEITTAIASMRARLAMAWDAYQFDLATADGWAEAKWQRHVTVFTKEMGFLNRRILRYNLGAPSSSFQHLELDVEHEIERVKQSNLPIAGNDHTG